MDGVEAGGDQVLADGLGVDLGQEVLDLGVGRRGDPREDGIGVVVAGLDALEIEDREAAEARQLPGHPRVDDGIHGGGEDRDGELDPGERPGPGPRRPARSCRCRARATRPRSHTSAGWCRPWSGRRGATRRPMPPPRSGSPGSARSRGPPVPPHAWAACGRESTSGHVSAGRPGLVTSPGCAVTVEGQLEPARPDPDPRGRRGSARSRSGSPARRPRGGPRRSTATWRASCSTDSCGSASGPTRIANTAAVTIASYEGSWKALTRSRS